MDIWKINQLEAMHFANVAWCEVDVTTIQNCWRKAGILPEIKGEAVNPTIPISSLIHETSHMVPIVHAENQLQTALNDLERTSSLQRQNIMDIETLLNPPDESVIIDDATDDEIYQAVMDAQWVQDACLINGGDDVDNNNPTDKPCPMHHEVLQATLFINRYLDLDDGSLA